MKLLLTYKVPINEDISDLILEYKNRLNFAIDYIWNNMHWKKSKKKKNIETPILPKDNDFYWKTLRNELLKDFKYATHYTNSIITVSKAIIKSWKKNYLKGLRTKTKPVAKKDFVRVKGTLIKHDVDKGIVKITIEPRKRYLEIDLKQQWFYERVKDWKVTEAILKPRFVYLIFKKEIKTSNENKVVIGVDSNLKSLDIYHPKKGWIKIDISYIHRVKSTYDTIISKLQSIYKKAPKCISRLLKKYYKRRTNRVRDFIEKLTTQLSRMFPNVVFVFEDLEKLNMFSNSKEHNKKLSYVGWKQIMYKLSYKTKLNDSDVIFVNPAYTSKMCPRCGCLMETRDGHKMFCKNCNLEIDRQLNGAINIYKRGLEQLMGGAEVTVTGGEALLMNPNLAPNTYTVDFNGKFLKVVNY